MTFEHKQSVTVNLKNMYHVHIICDRIIKVESENLFCPMKYCFYKGEDLVAQIPCGYVESFRYFKTIFDAIPVTISDITDNN